MYGTINQNKSSPEDYNLAPNDILCNTYTQIKVTKKNSILVIKKFVLSLTVQEESACFSLINLTINMTVVTIAPVCQHA